MKRKKKILYIDMDGVLADFDNIMKELLIIHFPNVDYKKGSRERRIAVDNIMMIYDNFFINLLPIPKAMESTNKLMDSGKYEIYFLSTPVDWLPNSHKQKREWLNRYFGTRSHKKLILTHRKDLCIGDYLIDDRTINGAGKFKGELIQFGTKEYPDWDTVLKYLL